MERPKTIYNHLQPPKKIQQPRKRGYKTPGKNGLLSWQRQLSHNNKRKLCALDVTKTILKD